MREAERITPRRARAAAAPNDARPTPPANRGLLNKASRGRNEVDAGGLDIVWVGTFRGELV